MRLSAVRLPRVVVIVLALLGGPVQAWLVMRATTTTVAVLGSWGCSCKQAPCNCFALP